MIRFGMPTLIETSGIEECANICRELGLSFIEISMSLPQYTIDAIDVELFNNVARKYGVFFTLHLDENVNFADFNTHFSYACFTYVKEAIAIAKKISAPVINMHLHRGEHFTLPDRKIDLFEVYNEHYKAKVRAFYEMCEEEISDSGIKLCIENCKGYPAFQRNAIDKFLESPVFSLTYDIGHDHTANGADKDFIIERKNKLLHMHMHDATAKKDHLTLGKGEIDLCEYLMLAKERELKVVIETKTVESLRSSVDWLRKNADVLG